MWVKGIGPSPIKKRGNTKKKTTRQKMGRVTHNHSGFLLFLHFQKRCSVSAFVVFSACDFFIISLS